MLLIYSYSYLSESTGLSAAALLAGIIPLISATRKQSTSAIKIHSQGIINALPMA